MYIIHLRNDWKVNMIESLALICTHNIYGLDGKLTTGLYETSLRLASYVLFYKILHFLLFGCFSSVAVNIPCLPTCLHEYEEKFQVIWSLYFSSPLEKVLRQVFLKFFAETLGSHYWWITISKLVKYLLVRENNLNKSVYFHECLYICH